MAVLHHGLGTGSEDFLVFDQNCKNCMGTHGLGVISVDLGVPALGPGPGETFSLSPFIINPPGPPVRYRKQSFSVKEMFLD